jgi:hypothetical protein
MVWIGGKWLNTGSMKSMHEQNCIITFPLDRMTTCPWGTIPLEVKSPSQCIF